MDRWPIIRRYTVSTESRVQDLQNTDNLSQFRVVCMLGAAGLGKTRELRHLAQLERDRGLDVREERLVCLGQTSDGLKVQLESLLQGATQHTVVCLDALDEVMVPIETAALVLATWIRGLSDTVRPSIRISCRSAVWPLSVLAALREVYGPEHVAVALLEPLSVDDVLTIAKNHGLDSDQFYAAIQRSGTIVLAQRPITLKMLLRLFAENESLPQNRNQLLFEGTALLASDSIERREDGTSPNVRHTDIIDAAERLACLLVLSGRETVDLGDSPDAHSLGWRELDSLPHDGIPLSYDILRHVGRSGLCEGAGQSQFTFAHRQFAEFLAGRRLAKLPTHQSKALLSAGLGWRAGVAGPLRETAAFAASENNTLAQWLAECDREVIGLSDVADHDLRRRATLQLLQRFRSHELTDAHLVLDGLELAGFQYSNAETDLREVLQERGNGREDLLECALKLISSWSLNSMSDDLAELVLDPTAPYDARHSAGYILHRIGTTASQHRIKRLIAGGRDDLHHNLKGLALSCNWPDNLTIQELLDAITPNPDRGYHGAYGAFLHSLNRDSFAAEGFLIEGLEWATKHIHRDGPFDPISQIAQRIAHTALQELSQPGMAMALAKLLLESAQAHTRSPLSRNRHGFGESETDSVPPSPLLDTSSRRILIDAIIASATEETRIWSAGRETPDLLNLNDSPWLLDRATKNNLSLTQRSHFIALARMLPWYENSACVDAWLAYRHIEPIASRFPELLKIDLGSKEECEARKAHAEEKRWQRKEETPKLVQAPCERVHQVLDLCEQKDPRFFVNLCRELTLTQDSTEYDFERFLIETPGWAEADARTRERIVESAKRVLICTTADPDEILTRPLNSILFEYMPAVWLLMDRSKDWLDALPHEWWRRWSWYLLRELHPGLDGEPDDPKRALLNQLINRVPDKVYGSLISLCKNTSSESLNLLSSLLGLMSANADQELDRNLCSLIADDTISSDRVSVIADFVLTRHAPDAIDSCLARLDSNSLQQTDDSTISAAVALLTCRPFESFDRVAQFLGHRPDLVARVLSSLARSEHLGHRTDESPLLEESLTPLQVEQLLFMLFQSFPPQPDPTTDRGRGMESEYSARHLRDRLLSWLARQRDAKAIEALRRLESEFSSRDRWLRRLVLQAEREYHLIV